MAYNTNNKFRMYAENAVTEKDNINGIVYSDEDWSTNTARSTGAKSGLASSAEYNTALKQASLVATAVAEIFARRYGQEITTNIEGIGFDTYENYITALAEKFTKANMLLDGEVEVKHLSETLKSSTFNNMTVGNVNSKINGKLITSILESDGITAKKSTGTLHLIDASTNTSYKTRVLTQSAYDSIVSAGQVDNSTIYFIKEG